jgi:glycosidase
MVQDFYLLGEIWHDSISWLQGDEYDSVMNYPLTTAIADFWVYKNRGRETFEYDINRCFTMYYSQVNDVLFNLLDSHDTNRLLDKAQKNIDVFYQQLAVLFTMPGSPCIYYGTEVVMDGSYDPDCRRCMPWDEIASGEKDTEIGEMKKLISMRKTLQSCKSRNFHFPGDVPQERVISYLKIGDNETIQVYLNCEEEAVKIPVKGFDEVIYSRKWSNSESAEGTLEPNGILIVKQKKD